MTQPGKILRPVAVEQFLRIPGKPEQLIPEPLNIGPHGQPAAFRQLLKQREKWVSVCRIQHEAADRTGKINKMSAGFNLPGQTKRVKMGIRLPGSACNGRQNRENKKNVCRDQ